jgi:hypothetical protein
MLSQKMTLDNEVLTVAEPYAGAPRKRTGGLLWPSAGHPRADRRHAMTRRLDSVAALAIKRAHVA